MRLAEDRRDLAELDRMLETLRDARSLVTTRLEVAAAEVLRDVGATYGRCTRCYLVFDEFEADPLTAYFTTDCTWCGSWSQRVMVETVRLEMKMAELDEGEGA